MKKIYSLFILSILALTMFVGCQMNPEDVKDVLNPTYRVNITDNAYKANVSVDKVTPKAGYTVIITITVPDDFTADDLKVSVMKGSETITPDDIESTKTNEVKKSFIMPESDVDVTVNFEKKATPTETTPTDDNDNDNAEDPVDNTPTEGADDGEDNTGDGEEEPKPVDNNPTVIYTVLAPDGSEFASGLSYEEFVYYKNVLVAGLDYVEIDDHTCKLTTDGYNKVTNNTPVVNPPSDETTEEPVVDNDEGGNGNGESGTETTSETYSVLARASDGYRLDNTSSESGKEVVLPIMTSEGTTPTGLYLVNVRIEDKSTGNDIKSTVGLKIEDNKIKFTMPSNNVDVFASFENVSFKNEYDKNNNGRLYVTTEKSNDLDFYVGIRFTEKVFDNLEYIDGVYVFRVAKKDVNLRTEWSDGLYWRYDYTIETTYTGHVLCAIVGEKVKIPTRNKIELK